jgi:hypothetical protein
MSKEQFIHVDSRGNKRYFSDSDHKILHREDGPALICPGSSGSKEWYREGKLHREDGPAIVWPDGTKWWYLNDKHLSEEEFNARVK